MEPPAVGRGIGSRRRPPRGFEVGAARTVQGAAVGAGLAAATVGLLGIDAGLIWLVAGIWLARAVWGRRPNLAWALACLAAGLRWGTLSLGDVQAASRALGPAIAVQSPVFAIGAGLALAGALLEAAAEDGLRSVAPPERAAAGLALVAVVTALAVPGPGEPNLAASLGLWVGACGAAAAVQLAAARFLCHLPWWGPSLLAGFGVVVVGVGGSR